MILGKGLVGPPAASGPAAEGLKEARASTGRKGPSKTDQRVRKRRPARLPRVANSTDDQTTPKFHPCLLCC